MTTPIADPQVEGAYWREVLADAMEVGGSRWSVADLLARVAGCQVGLVDVAGWLSDELRLGRVLVTLEDDDPPGPLRYELTPGVRSHRRGVGR
jgi:hypothetical protein